MNDVNVMITSDKQIIKTPDVTKAQVIAHVQPILTALVAFGILDLTSTEEMILIGGFSGLLSLVTLIADAIIRHGRSIALSPPSSE